MKTTTITYFSTEDVLFVPLKNEKSSIGDEEYQDDVVLFRNTRNEMVAIEIQKFSFFKKNKIQLCDDQTIDLKDIFEKVRMLISCRDIMDSDPVQFEKTLKEWGIDISNEDKDKADIPKNIYIKAKLPAEFANC